MTGRDIDEGHRAATTLELFFDLTFVTAFGVAAAQFAHGVAAGHVVPATIAFAISLLAIVWAWTGYSWFASAFDNDDWLFRVLTLVQMLGVIIVAIGIPALFTSIEDGGELVGEVMVVGYVIMRVAVVAQWCRVLVDDPRYRGLALGNIVSVSVAQVGWVVFIIAPISLHTALPILCVLWLIDLSGPAITEVRSRRRGIGSPWHPHHIAERYSLLAIIAIGETITGTLASAQEISSAQGWSLSTVVIVGAGALVSFSLWWAYFLLPSAPILAVRRDKVLPWAYGHAIVYASITAVGAGVHVLGYVFDHEFHVSTFTAVTTVAVPVLIFLVAIFVLHAWLVGAVPRDIGHVVAFAAPLCAMAMGYFDLPLWACVLVVLASPLSVVFSYELWEWRTLAAQLDAALDRAH